MELAYVLFGIATVILSLHYRFQSNYPFTWYDIAMILLVFVFWPGYFVIYFIILYMLFKAKRQGDTTK